MFYTLPLPLNNLHKYQPLQPRYRAVTSTNYLSSTYFTPRQSDFAKADFVT